MRSLFWKIFLSFLTTVLIIELGTAWTMARLHQAEIHPILEKANHRFVEYSHEARDYLLQHGLAEFNEWKRINPRPDAVEDMYVLDRFNRDIDGRELPPKVRAFLKEYVEDHEVPEHSHPIEHVLKSDFLTPQGEHYLLITTFHPPSVIAYLLTPQRVAVGLFVSALICFLMARYFALPIVRLRQATQALASGRLDVQTAKDLRARNDEFGALAQDFDYMATRLNDMVNTQKQMLRDISHELRSPLARIQVAVELARGEKQLNDSAELTRIETEVTRLNTLIDELLTFVRMSAANQVLEKSPVRIGEVLNNIVHDANFERSVTSPDRSIELERCDDAVLNANEPLLYSAIENVLRNACYYTPPNEKIRICCAATPEAITVRIEDRGPGIPENMLAKVFEPFVRVSSAREKDAGGYGIGLAIAKRVIDVHGGTITAANNEKNPGLTVTIQLPNNTLSLVANT